MPVTTGIAGFLRGKSTKTPHAPQCNRQRTLIWFVGFRLWRRRIWGSNYARGAEMIYVGIRLQLKEGGKPNAKKVWLSRMTAGKLWRRLLSRRLQPLSLSNQLQFSLWLLWRRAHWMLLWRLLRTLVLSHGLFQGFLPISKDAQHCGSSLCAILSGIVWLTGSCQWGLCISCMSRHGRLKKKAGPM